MPTGAAKGTLTDIGTEELAHLEIIATMVYKLLKDVLRKNCAARAWEPIGPSTTARFIPRTRAASPGVPPTSGLPAIPSPT